VRVVCYLLPVLSRIPSTVYLTLSTVALSGLSTRRFRPLSASFGRSLACRVFRPSSIFRINDSRSSPQRTQSTQLPHGSLRSSTSANPLIPVAHPSNHFCPRGGSIEVERFVATTNSPHISFSSNNHTPFLLLRIHPRSQRPVHHNAARLVAADDAARHSSRPLHDPLLPSTPHLSHRTRGRQTYLHMRPRHRIVQTRPVAPTPARRNAKYGFKH